MQGQTLKGRTRDTRRRGKLSARDQFLKAFGEAQREGRKHFLEEESDSLLLAYGIPVAASVLAKNADEAGMAASKLGFPVVEKIVSPDILHKSDVGGVKINITSEEEARAAFDQISSQVLRAVSKARIQGVLVQKMIKGGTETIVGGSRDPQFGPVVVFGLGGIFVEILKDVSFRVAPIDREEALDMIKEIRSAPILNGFRGTPAADKEALASVIVSVGRLMIENPEISSLDLNPVMALPSGAVTVDSRILIG